MRVNSGHKLCFIVLACVILGCGDAKYKIRIRHKPEPAKLVLVALKSEDPNERLHALRELKKSGSFAEPWAVSAVGLIAQTDPSSTIRAYATYLLGKVATDECVNILAEVLDDPSAKVRRASALALSEIDFESGNISSTTKRKSKSSLISVLTADEDVDVRIYSARALRSFKDKEVLYALISALKDSDFAVKYEAEQSLIALTGRTFHYNAESWLAWLQNPENKDPFEDAGKVPPELQSPRRSIWQRVKDKIYQWYLNWQGPAKP